mmetsp:Transcript_52380/g.135174  ORF Transcript_52380/g.135174 Transcript_52380/m.135174 type:complete len:357 (+) Transcript_52380:823-1893(+)
MLRAPDDVLQLHHHALGGGVHAPLDPELPRLLGGLPTARVVKQDALLLALFEGLLELGLGRLIHTHGARRRRGSFAFIANGVRLILEEEESLAQRVAHGEMDGMPAILLHGRPAEEVLVEPSRCCTLAARNQVHDLDDAKQVRRVRGILPDANEPAHLGHQALGRLVYDEAVAAERVLEHEHVNGVIRRDMVHILHNLATHLRAQGLARLMNATDVRHPDVEVARPNTRRLRLAAAHRGTSCAAAETELSGPCGCDDGVLHCLQLAGPSAKSVDVELPCRLAVWHLEAEVANEQQAVGRALWEGRLPASASVPIRHLRGHQHALHGIAQCALDDTHGARSRSPKMVQDPKGGSKSA